MSLVRLWLARALVALLLVQWANAPVRCLATAAFNSEAPFLCHADPDGSSHSGGRSGGAVSPDQCCPACHALAHISLPDNPAGFEFHVTWSLLVSYVAQGAGASTTLRASPHQPRAPPTIPA